jgi:hypothetical protein
MSKKTRPYDARAKRKRIAAQHRARKAQFRRCPECFSMTAADDRICRTCLWCAICGSKMTCDGCQAEAKAGPKGP